MLGFFLFFFSVPLIIEQAVHGRQQIIRLSVCARLARQLTRGILGHSGYQVPYSPWQANSRDTMLIVLQQNAVVFDGGSYRSAEGIFYLFNFILVYDKYIKIFVRVFQIADLVKKNLRYICLLAFSSDN